MNALTDLYGRILTAMGCKVQDDGLVLLQEPGTNNWNPVMVTVDGVKKQLVVPYRSVLKDGDWSKLVAFHPAGETVFNTQSEVLNTLINLASLRLHHAVQVAVVSILALAADTSKHGKLRNSQHRIVVSLPEVNQTALKYFTQVASKGTGISGHRPLLSLRLYRGRVVNGVKYNRVCKMLTPILDEADPIYGVKASGNAQKALRKAYELCFPESKEFGTNSDGNPNLESVLAMYQKAALHLNELYEVMGKYSGEMELLDISWFEDSKNIKKLAKEFIPQPLPGNTGVPTKSQHGNNDTEMEIVIPAAKMPNNPSSPVVQKPVTNVLAKPAAPTVDRLASPPAVINVPQVQAIKPNNDRLGGGFEAAMPYQQVMQPYGYGQQPMGFAAPQPYGYPQQSLPYAPQPNYGYAPPAPPQYGYGAPAPARQVLTRGHLMNNTPYSGNMAR